MTNYEITKVNDIYQLTDKSHGFNFLPFSSGLYRVTLIGPGFKNQLIGYCLDFETATKLGKEIVKERPVIGET